MICSWIPLSDFDQIYVGRPLRYPLSNKNVEIGQLGKDLSLNIHKKIIRRIENLLLFFKVGLKGKNAFFFSKR